MKQSRRVSSFTTLLIILFSLSSPLMADNWFDEQFMYPYNETLSLVSDITSIATVLAPSTLLFVAPFSDWVGIGLTYGSTVGISYGARTLMKGMISRQRPYLYPGNTQNQPQDTSKQNQSFPSGHTLMAFSAAAFTQTQLSLSYPDSPYKRAVTLTSWALATTTALLRVASGNHYVTDVLAGAAIGSLLGFAGSYLSHLIFKDNENAPTLMLGPTIGVGVRL